MQPRRDKGLVETSKCIFSYTLTSLHPKLQCRGTFSGNLSRSYNTFDAPNCNSSLLCILLQRVTLIFDLLTHKTIQQSHLPENIRTLDAWWICFYPASSDRPMGTTSLLPSASAPRLFFGNCNIHDQHFDGQT